MLGIQFAYEIRRWYGTSILDLCWIHSLQRIVSVSFSLLSLRMAGGHEYALYAASRSVALPLAVIYAMALRSRGGVATLAVAMALVQLFDGIVGFRLHDPGRAYGPMAFAAINFGLLFWMNRLSPISIRDRACKACS
jgi:hypothetical protein